MQGARENASKTIVDVESDTLGRLPAVDGSCGRRIGSRNAYIDFRGTSGSAGSARSEDEHAAHDGRRDGGRRMGGRVGHLEFLVQFLKLGFPLHGLDGNAVASVCDVRRRE